MDRFGLHQCPECGETIDPREIICPCCGHSVLNVDPYSPADPRMFIPPPRRRSARRMWLGVVVGNLAAFAQIVFGQWVFHHNHALGNACITANYAIVPVIVGFLGGFYWRTVMPTPVDLLGYSALSAFFLIVISVCLPNFSLLVFLISIWFFLPVWCGATFVIWMLSLLGNVIFRLPDETSS